MALLKRVALFIIFVSLILCTHSTGELYLTPMVKNNKLIEARNLSLVNLEDIHIQSYSGFLTVNEAYNSNLFFWYFPVANTDINETPWIIWLQGGPGASSLFGLFKEVGPLEYNDGIQLRHTSWSKHYSMVFIDNPVGAGFSFTDKDEGYPEGMEMYSDNLYTAVKQLAQIYPELGKAPLYIAGESYAGRYIPGLAMKILDGQENGENFVNLQGLIMGNPTLDRDSAMDYINAFYGWGMIDAQGARAAQSLQEEFQQAVRNEDPIKAYDLRNLLLDKLLNTASKIYTYNALKGYNHFDDYSKFLDTREVREGIHVGYKAYNFSSGIVHVHMMKDSLASVSPKIEKILEQCRVLIYCGQLDLTTPCVQMAEARRKKWHWSHKEDFLKAPRLPWIFGSSLAGYVKSGGRLTEVSITGSGHLVGIDKPAELQHLVTSFIENTPLQSPENFADKHLPEYEEYIPEQTSSNNSYRIGFILSAILNVLLLVGIVVGVVYFWKKFQQEYYSSLPLTEDFVA